MAKNSIAKSAVAAATKAVKGKAKQETAKQDAAPAEDVQRFKGKLVKVIDGKKNKGEILKCFAVTKGRPATEDRRAKKPLALCEGAAKLTADDQPLFMNLAHLEIVGDMAAADIKRLEARQTAQAEETLYVAGSVTFESDKAVQLRVPGWLKRVYFSKATGDKPAMISATGFQTSDDLDIFEVAGWKVRKEVGNDSYNVLKSKQAAFAAIVEQPSKAAAKR